MDGIFLVLTVLDGAPVSVNVLTVVVAFETNLSHPKLDSANGLRSLMYCFDVRL